MKQIDNKKVSIIAPVFNDGKMEDKVIASNYGDLIKITCDSPIQGGYGIEDIDIRIAIKSQCDHSSDKIQLEDAHVVYLQKAVKSMRWTVLSEDISKFVKDIETGFTDTKLKNIKP